MNASTPFSNAFPMQERLQKFSAWLDRAAHEIYDSYRPLFDWRQMLSKPYSSQTSFNEFLNREIRADDTQIRRTIVAYALAALAAKAISEDGEMTPKKRKAFATIFSLQDVTAEKMLTLFDVAYRDKAPALQYARQLKSLHREGEQLLEQALRRLARISMFEGPLTLAAYHYLCMVGETFGYTVEQIAGLVNEIDGPAFGDAYTLLKIAPNTNLKQIQDAYRARMRNVHPDRWRNIGRTAPLHRLFTAKAAAINEAYRQLTGLKGEGKS